MLALPGWNGHGCGAVKRFDDMRLPQRRSRQETAVPSVLPVRGPERRRGDRAGRRRRAAVPASGNSLPERVHFLCHFLELELRGLDVTKRGVSDDVALIVGDTDAAAGRAACHCARRWLITVGRTGSSGAWRR
jgi:hypothetical protein